MRHVSTATREQALAADDINKAIQDLNTVIRQNSDAVSSLAEMISDMSMLTEGLTKSVVSRSGSGSSQERLGDEMSAGENTQHLAA